MPNTENRKNSNKKPTLQEHSQTVIIPQLTPEMLEQARRAAEQGKTAEQIEQEALAAAQAEQKAVESKQEAPTAEKPKTVQPANKPKTRKEAEEELEIAYDGGTLEIGFNINYLTDVLTNLSAETLQLAFGDGNRSALFTLPEQADFKYIVMPMRI